MMMDERLADPAVVGEMAALMRLLGDGTRIRVLGLLQRGEMNVSALCGELELAQPTVSHHLGLLRDAGLLLTRRAGKQVYYSLNPKHITAISEESMLRLNLGQISMRLGYGGTSSSRSCQGAPALN